MQCLLGLFIWLQNISKQLVNLKNYPLTNQDFMKVAC